MWNQETITKLNQKYFLNPKTNYKKTKSTNRILKQHWWRSEVKPVEGWWRLLRTWWTYHSIKSKYKSIIAIRNIDGVCSINVSITNEPLVWCPTYAHTYQCSCEPLMQFSITARLQHLEGPGRRTREPSVLNSIPASYWLSLPSLFSLSLVPRLFLTAFFFAAWKRKRAWERCYSSLSLSLSLSFIHSTPPLLYSPSTTLVSHPRSLQGQIPGGLGNHLPDTPLQSGTNGPHCAPSDEGTPGVWVLSLNDVQVHLWIEGMCENVT